jgi:TolA-binding protein
MRTISLLLAFLLSMLEAFSAPSTDSLLVRLRAEFERKAGYDRQKENRLARLRAALLHIAPDNSAAQWEGCRQLYEEYKSYQYDSAYRYGSRMYAISHATHDLQKENFSKVKLGFILLSAGKYKEAFSLMQSIDYTGFDSLALGDFYAVMTRAYFDLASYDNDTTWSPAYKKQGIAYIDSSLRLYPPGTYSRLFLTSYRCYSLGDNAAAIDGFLNFYKQYKPTDRDDAITTSLLSELYLRTGRTEQATDFLIRAVIADLQNSTKETSAIFRLAELVSRNGDVDDAFGYVQEALKDAEFYGARQRQIQISAILPLITAQKVNFVESQERRFLVYLSSTILLLLLIALFSILLYKQLQQRKANEKIIRQNNVQLAAMNQELLAVNTQLIEANKKLSEDAHIKEEYIGYFFNVISGYIGKLEQLKVSIEAKLIQNKLDQIQPIINQIQVNEERERLFQTFDSVFLKIFPNFVTSFNALFKKEDQVWPKGHEILNTDLRIFALTRLGIADNESIARILQYSSKTVYVYRMRLKAKSIYPAAEFDQRLMQIQAVEMQKPPIVNTQDPA